MDDGLRTRLHDAAARLGVPCRAMPSGGGHDAAVFAGEGVPTAMVFVRNPNGSHNPDEAMALADFAAAWRVLAATVDGLVDL
jgi:N-carbamoyl-L-amino-acid hydrolase